jgi:osmotically-inducible protein OsmY
MADWRDDDRSRWDDRPRRDDERGGYGGQRRGPGGRFEGGYGRDQRDMRVRRGRDFGQDYYGHEYGGGYSAGDDRDRADFRHDDDFSERLGRARGASSRRYGDDDRRDWFERTRDEVASWFGDDDAERRRDMDRYREMDRRRGGHYGKGPKGYRRSDERIREDVSDRLADAWDLDASEIEVSVQDCEVTLTGTVDSREEKRRAEDLAEEVSGVRHVQNNLRVQRAGGMGTDTIPGANRAGQAS